MRNRTCAEIGDAVKDLAEQRAAYLKACGSFVFDFPEVVAIVKDGKTYETEMRRQSMKERGHI